jgi:hypothetical protein
VVHTDAVRVEHHEAAYAVVGEVDLSARSCSTIEQLGGEATVSSI